MNRYSCLTLVVCSSVLFSHAELTEKKRKLEESFQHVPAPELGATAAQLIRSTSPLEREETAVAIVETVLTRNPAAAVAIVSAIAKAAPQTASAIVAAANRVAPATSEYVAIAARNAAPAYAQSINSTSAPQIIPSHPSVASANESKSEHGNPGNDQGNGIDNGRRGGVVEKDDTLPNGKPRPGVPVPPRRPPHPEHPDHPEHPPHPIQYNKPHDHGHGDEDHDRDEHGH